MSTNPHHGSFFEDFLRDEGPGRLEEATIQAKKITKVEMAKRIGTSRAELDRVLNPGYTGVQVDTLARAAAAVGAEIRIELIET